MRNPEPFHGISLLTPRVAVGRSCSPGLQFPLLSLNKLLSAYCMPGLVSGTGAQQIPVILTLSLRQQCMGVPSSKWDPPPRCDHSALLLYLFPILQGEHGQRVEWRKWKQQSK